MIKCKRSDLKSFLLKINEKGKIKLNKSGVNEFITIKNNVETEIVEKKSKFIANLFYIENSEQAEKMIKETKKKYFDARHNCIAYRTVEDNKIVERFSDDGEPSGTAGAPMLNILQKNGYVNVLIVVTRYFGGILLGTGGLVRAYSNSLIQAIEKSEKIKKCMGEILEVKLEYNELENFKYYCKNNKINIVETQYYEKIMCKIEIEYNKKQKILKDYETKKIKIIEINELYKKYITKCIWFCHFHKINGKIFQKRLKNISNSNIMATVKYLQRIILGGKKWKKKFQY